MTEANVGFLYNAASCLLQSQNNSSKTVLRSYFLMRCDEIAKTAELPNKYFSAKVRCPHCYIEWNSETVLKVKSKKLSNQQRRRLKLKAVKRKNSNLLKELSYNKELEQICSFCKHKTNTPLVKQDREKEITEVSVPKDNKDKNNTAINKVALSNLKKTKESSINVYASSKDIFSLNNRDNTLKSTVKEEAKVIKNNKKKKDKFAGLCQKAVLATAKLKEEQKKQNKLNLFLKPST
ncbi:uncharacterized protein LOC128680441 [Plodia interpunctella]|uniref:uncharacterized protein LOC128680441 n=1 Tax=Plodia interpunctella TaxID=58824 RepID=UPI0023677DE1|nr:uncharacterized protein LOC128680441 [Plodia interpunctella]